MSNVETQNRPPYISNEWVFWSRYSVPKSEIISRTDDKKERNKLVILIFLEIRLYGLIELLLQCLWLNNKTVLSLTNIIIFISVIFFNEECEKKGMHATSRAFIVTIKRKLIVSVGWSFFYLCITELPGISQIHNSLIS